MLSGKTHEIRRLYDQYADIVRPQETLDPRSITRVTPLHILELEAKYGYYTPRGFNSNVPFIHFERLLNVLRSRAGREIMRGSIVSEEVTQESHVAQSGNIRRVTITAFGDEPETILWQRKQRIQDFELPEYDIRVSVNREDNLTPTEIPQPFIPDVVRERTRHSFTLANGLIQVDMTEVMMRAEDKVVRPRYEVELEYLGRVNDLPIFEEHMSLIFRFLRGTNLVYTNTIKNRLIMDSIKILGGARPDMIDKDVLVEARNIKRRDLVWGGIVGNRETSYLITFKADGLRKMLIIHATGIWLVYPPFEFNLVLNLSLNVPQLDKLLGGFAGTIFDGELVTPKPEANKQVAYWYLAFDCLSFRGNAAIQNQGYAQRQQVVNAIAGAMKTQILTIDTKDTKEIKTPLDFFNLVAEFLDKRATLDYNEDGLIFVPANIKYNPHSEKYKLHDRSLVRIPDICKWKGVEDITIDFAIKRVEPQGTQNRLELYSYDEESETMVPFVGDIINPLTPDMIDHDNPLTLNKPTNLVVEYEWVPLPGPLLEFQDKRFGIFRPRRIRYDKSGPNRLSIALDDWEDIMNPITEEDIRGESLMMVFSYHNRIKKGLYHVIPRGSNILDIGSGYGGDVSKWGGLATKVKGAIQPATGLVVAVEPSERNRRELLSRINTFKMQDRVSVVATGGEDTVNITKAVREFIPGGKVDVITLMLSMSFFWASDAHLDALIATIITNLKPGGMILFLTVNGDVIEQIFEPALGGDYITDKTIATAQLHLYPRPNVGFGRPIDFFLPDTIVGEQREYIVHLRDLSLRLAQYGFTLAEVHRAEGERLLSDSNSLFSSMYSYGYYVNDNKTALIEYEQTARFPVNTILPAIPLPTKSPNIQMNQPSPQTIPPIVATPLPPTTPRLTHIGTSPRSPPRSPIIQQVPTLPTPVTVTAGTTPIVPTIPPPSPRPPVIIPSPAQTQPISPVVTVPTTIEPPQTPKPTIVIPPLNQGPTTPNPTIVIPPVIPNILTQIGQGILIPKLNKYQIEQTQLSWLPVSYAGKGGRIREGPANNDDTYAPLTCTWYDNLVRIATIGDGSCFIHAVLKGFYKAYQETNGARYRLSAASQIRRDLAIVLGLENPQYPGHTYWETSARGAFPRMVMQQINDEDLVRQLRVDYSLAGLQRLFNSTSQLGDEVYTFVADALNIDIYVLRATRQDLYPHLHTRRPGVLRNGIVVIGNMYHYEVLAVNGEHGFQTLFPPNDPFLEALTDVFVGDGDFNDIVNNVPYNPDDSFIQDVIEAFMTPEGFQLPPIVTEIFPETDPFRQALNRLAPRIEEAARLRVIALNTPSPPREQQHPVITQLNGILAVMEQSGFSAEQIQNIREIVEHRLDLNPDIPQDLNGIIATAETDGIIDHDTVAAIINVQATM